jgi:hypothetical protein
MESTPDSSTPQSSSAIWREPVMSAQTCSTYLSKTPRENTSDAKLQKLHFVRQNGTEM